MTGGIGGYEDCLFHLASRHLSEESPRGIISVCKAIVLRLRPNVIIDISFSTEFLN